MNVLLNEVICSCMLFISTNAFLPAVYADLGRITPGTWSADEDVFRVLAPITLKVAEIDNHWGG